MNYFLCSHHCNVFLYFICINFFFLQAICTEAGLLALRDRRMKVTQEDFMKAKDSVLYLRQDGIPEGLYS